MKKQKKKSGSRINAYTLNRWCFRLKFFRHKLEEGEKPGAYEARLKFWDSLGCHTMYETRQQTRSELEQMLRDNLTPDEQRVISAYYLDGVPTWEQVADKLHYSVSRIYQLRRSAFEKIYCIDNRTNVS